MKPRRKASPIIATAAPAGKAVRWSIFRFGKKMAWLGHVEAVSESEAIAKGCELFKVSEADRFRIKAKPEE